MCDVYSPCKFQSTGRKMAGRGIGDTSHKPQQNPAQQDIFKDTEVAYPRVH